MSRLTPAPDDNAPLTASLSPFLQPSSGPSAATASPRKRSLVNKLDDLKRSSSPSPHLQRFPHTPNNTSLSSRSSADSPLSAYLRTAALCSTPKHQGNNGNGGGAGDNNNASSGGGGGGDGINNATFDTRTFTRNRPSPTRFRLAPAPTPDSPGGPANLTFDKSGGGGLGNATFTASPASGNRDATFEVDEPHLRLLPPPGDLPLNATFEVSPGGGGGGAGDPAEVEERLSVASDASSGQRRLYSVGDVQHVAKMQEESESII